VLLPRRLLALALGVLTTRFVACATDVGIDDEGSGGKSDASAGGSGGSGGKDGGIAGSDGGWPTGGFGGPCNKDSDCDTKICADIGQGKPNLVCVVPCQPPSPCPSGGYCTFHPNKGYICVPDSGNQCEKCTVDADCPVVGDRCTPSPQIDRFCAHDCSKDLVCPSGFDCVAVGSYPPGKPPVQDGGVADSGSGEAGPPTSPPKMCVPKNNESCPCNSKRDGVKRRCTKTQGSVTCEGTETCNASTQKWEGCTATSPQPEVCDGADNDCNGTPDDTTIDKLCGATAPPHAKWACNFGACEIGSCDTGYAAYPPGPAKNGCACQVEATEPANNTCAGAVTSAGSVTDANTTPLTLKGSLSADNDEDWFKFDTTDADETTTNSYHIKIAFTAPASNSEFVFDVIRGAKCGTPDAKHSNLTDYDWCVDGTGTVGGKAVGEKTCGPTASIHCGPHTKPYLVRVRRKAGATPSCTQYTLSVTAKGGAACDFTQACDAQINET